MKKYTLIGIYKDNEKSMKTLEITKELYEGNATFRAEIKDEYKQILNCNPAIIVDNMIKGSKRNITVDSVKYHLNGCSFKTIEGNKIYFLHINNNNAPAGFIYFDTNVNQYIFAHDVKITYTELVEKYGYETIVIKEVNENQIYINNTTPDYILNLPFKDALERTIELLKDKNITFDARCDIANNFCSYYPYFDSSRFDKYF